MTVIPDDGKEVSAILDITSDQQLSLIWIMVKQ